MGEQWRLLYSMNPMVSVIDGFRWSLLAAPFSYALLHGGLGHLALNGVMLAVMGQVLERRGHVTRSFMR